MPAAEEIDRPEAEGAVDRLDREAAGEVSRQRRRRQAFQREKKRDAAEIEPQPALRQKLGARNLLSEIGPMREGRGLARLDLTIATFESGPSIIQAAASGGIDLYVAGVAPADAFRRFHADTGRPAKIATQPPGSVPAVNLQYWLREAAHVDQADVRIAPIGIDATQQAILAEAVDAATVREPTLTIIQSCNPQIALIASGEDLFPGQPGTVVAVSGAFFLEAHPEAVQTIVNAIVRAIDELQKAPDRAAPHIEAALRSASNPSPGSGLRIGFAFRAA